MTRCGPDQENIGEVRPADIRRAVYPPELTYRFEIDIFAPGMLLPGVQKMMAKRLAADRRAKRLLNQHLTKEQKKTLKKKDSCYIDLLIEKPYRRRKATYRDGADRELLHGVLWKPRVYRILPQRADSVLLRSAYERNWRIRACVSPHPDMDFLPIWDCMLAVKLLLEGDEAHFWDLAVWSCRHYEPYPPSG